MGEGINQQILYFSLSVSVTLVALTTLAPQLTPFRPERVPEPFLYLVEQASIRVQRPRLLHPQHLLLDG